MRGLMNNQRIEESPMRINHPRREVMKEPEEVAAMLRLWAVGWGLKRIVPLQPSYC
jgi:hypothetical protein